MVKSVLLADTIKAYARAINPRIQAGGAWSWHTSTPGLLAHAIREHGWGFIPNQVMPPLLANVTVGAVQFSGFSMQICNYEPPYATVLSRMIDMYLARYSSRQ